MQRERERMLLRSPHGSSSAPKSLKYGPTPALSPWTHSRLTLDTHFGTGGQPQPLRVTGTGWFSPSKCHIIRTETHQGLGVPPWIHPKITPDSLWTPTVAPEPSPSHSESLEQAGLAPSPSDSDGPHCPGPPTTATTKHQGLTPRLIPSPQGVQ